MTQLFGGDDVGQTPFVLFAFFVVPITLLLLHAVVIQFLHMVLSIYSSRSGKAPQAQRAWPLIRRIRKNAEGVPLGEYRILPGVLTPFHTATVTYLHTMGVHPRKTQAIQDLARGLH